MLIFQKLVVFVVAICLLTALPVFADGKVDVNTAKVEELVTLRGISKVRAEAIIRYREANGPYKSLEDLKNVRGIGDKIIEKNKQSVTFGPASTSENME